MALQEFLDVVAFRDLVGTILLDVLASDQSKTWLHPLLVSTVLHPERFEGSLTHPQAAVDSHRVPLLLPYLTYCSNNWNTLKHVVCRILEYKGGCLADTELYECCRPTTLCYEDQTVPLKVSHR